ncbi:MAG: hypothetical protein U5N86_11505 [Planctomycetota bacterium]|nr:hypothetical protein [Planctomycetota bacterium]
MQKVHKISDLTYVSLNRSVHPERFGSFRFQRVEAGGLQAYIYLMGLGHVAVFTTSGSFHSEVICPDIDGEQMQGHLKSRSLDGMDTFMYSREGNIVYRVSMKLEKLTQGKYVERFKKLLFNAKKGRLVNWLSGTESSGNSISIAYPTTYNDCIVLDVHHFFGRERTVLRSLTVAGKADG